MLVPVKCPLPYTTCEGQGGGGDLFPCLSPAASLTAQHLLRLLQAHIPGLNRGCPKPLPPQAWEPSSQGKLVTLQKVGEKGTDFLNFPGLLSSPLPSGQRHKGRCQFVRLPQAIPDLWLPTMRREAGCEKALKSQQRGGLSPDSLINPSHGW